MSNIFIYDEYAKRQEVVVVDAISHASIQPPQTIVFLKHNR